jgi:putative cell wall-binding protein
VTVAVLDTGIRVDHVDLAANIDTTHMRDIYMETSPGTITSPNNPTGDKNGHGTHVAGIVAAVADNVTGVTGASFNAKVLPLKVFDNQSTNPGAFTSDLVAAYAYLLDLVEQGELNDLHVINMSLGGYGAPSAYDLLLQGSISEAREDYDILTVCAGGNGYQDSSDPSRYGQPRTEPMYPSDFAECLSVTALDAYGCNVLWSDYNASKDISAPGSSILSTYGTNASSYVYLSGTSMASPLVAGAAALLWSVDDDLTVSEALTALYTTARPINDTTRDRTQPDGNGVSSGSHGALDAAAAVDYVYAHYLPDASVALSACVVTGPTDQFYTGAPLTPTPTISYQGQLLTKDQDYTLTWKNNRNVGTATVEISGKGNYRGTLTRSFVIAYDFAQATCSGLGASYSYTGTPLTPAVQISYGGQTLEKDVDYSLSYRDNTEVGTGYVVVTGKGGYRGTLEIPFQIAQLLSISACVVTGPDDQAYTGELLTPAFEIRYNGQLLVEDRDYSLAWENNRDVGAAAVTINGIGNYGDTLTRSFVIYYDFTQAKHSGVEQSYYYTGTPFTPAAQISYGSQTLEKDVDYSLSYRDNTEVGTGYVVATGEGSYRGTLEIPFEIVRRVALSACDVTGPADQAYTGELLTPAPAISYQGQLLVEGRDYQLSWRYNRDVGIAQVTIGGIGGYEGTLTRSFAIAYDLAQADYDAFGTYQYTGEPITPSVKFRYDERELWWGRDFSVSYRDNTAVGTGYIVVTGQGSYCGTVQIPFQIVTYDIAEAQVFNLYARYPYLGIPVVPDFSLGVTGRVLVRDVDFQLAISGNDAPGTVTMTITGIRGFYGQRTLSFELTAPEVKPAPEVTPTPEVTPMPEVTPAPEATFEATELAGSDRIATALAIARESYPQGASSVIITYAHRFPDALSATALAGVLNAPILLSDSATLNDDTLATIQALGASQAVILGSEESLAASVRRQVEGVLGSGNVVRLGGANRFETNRAIYEYGKTRGAWAKGAIVTTGNSFPDALSISPLAVSDRFPLFLTDNTVLPPASQAALAAGDFADVLIVGNELAVSAATEEWLVARYGRAHVIRLAGANRYETNDAIVKWLTSSAGYRWNHASIASGTNFPDALAGSILAGVRKAPILLANSGQVGSLHNLETNSASIAKIYFFGTTDAVPEAVRMQARQYLGW